MPAEPDAIRPATLDDLPALVDLQDAFYRESEFALDRPRAAEAFRQLVSDASLGRVWVATDAGAPVGYIVLTLGYSLEYGGRDAFVDDLFIRESHRGRGLGRRALAALLDAARALGVRAVHLEVARDNVAAKALYATFGFADNDRQLLTASLAEPLDQPSSAAT